MPMLVKQYTEHARVLCCCVAQSHLFCLALLQQRRAATAEHQRLDDHMVQELLQHQGFHACGAAMVVKL